MKKCELLAPAGGKEQYIAAVENGADAVYLGGYRMNARMGAANFSIEEMEKAVDYGHLRDVKTYVTMNTLVYGDELSKGLDYAAQLYQIGVDAVIIQDIGLGYEIKKNIPDLPLHLSTQATVYNRRGVEAAANLGYDRVVLARELSFQEIKECSIPQIIETEVFIHGALCFCYSGQCQLSRAIGGRSANRGTCAQPCRLPYVQKYSKGEHKESAPSNYPLSPKDLSAIDFIGEYVKAGASSLKIEGRMKSAEYVATVVGIYRKYLDIYNDYGQYRVDPKDKQALLQIFNRGGFTRGYGQENPGKDLMVENLPKHQGVFAGTIIKTDKRGNLAEIKTEPDIELKKGDIFEIHATDLVSGTITYLDETNKSTTWFGDVKGKVSAGDRVYRIISAEQMAAMRETYKNTDFGGGKFGRRSPISMHFKGKLGYPLSMEVESPATEIRVGKTLEGYLVEKAKGKATTKEEVAEKMNKVGNTPFRIESVLTDIDEEAYIPVSLVNQLRRDVLCSLEDEIIKRYKHPAKNETVAIEKSDEENNLSSQHLGIYQHEEKSACVELYFYHISHFLQGDAIKEITKLKNKHENMEITSILPLGELLMTDDRTLLQRVLDKSKTLGIRCMLYLEHISKGELDSVLEQNIKEAASYVNALGGTLYVGNMGWIKPFINAGVRAAGDFGLNVVNTSSETAYRTAGVKYCVPSIEMEGFHFGAVPLMTTEHHMATKELTDRKGCHYKVITLGASGKTLITKQRTEDLGTIVNKTAKDFHKVNGKNYLRIYL